MNRDKMIGFVKGAFAVLAILMVMHGVGAAVTSLRTGNATITYNLSVDSPTFVVDSDNDNVGLGTVTPNASYKLDVIGVINASDFYDDGVSIVGVYLLLSGGTMTGDIAMGNQNIIGIYNLSTDYIHLTNNPSNCTSGSNTIGYSSNLSEMYCADYHVDVSGDTMSGDLNMDNNTLNNTMSINPGGLGVTLGNVWTANSTILGTTNQARPALLNEVATSTNPSIVPTWNDADTGIGRQGTDDLSLITGGVEALNIEEVGGEATIYMKGGDLDAWGNNITNVTNVNMVQDGKLCLNGAACTAYITYNGTSVNVVSP